MAHSEPSNATCIIYAEDDEEDFRLLSEMIEELYPGAFRVHCAGNGRAALALMEKMWLEGTRPCLLILDLDLPLLSGHGVLKSIWKDERFAAQKVVLYTISTSKRDREYAEKAGVMFITKPFLMGETRRAARKMIEYGIS